MKFRWVAIACVVTCASAVADNDDNTTGAKDPATYVFSSYVKGPVRLRCQKSGDLSSLTRSGLSCTADFDSERTVISFASALPVEGAEEQLVLGLPALVSVEEANGVNGASVRIVVIPRI